MSQFIIQTIGILALVFFSISLQKKNRSSILKFHIVSTLLYAVHFFLLGAFTAVAMVLLNGLKSYVFLFKTKYAWVDHKIVLYIFFALFIAAGFIFWEGYHSLLLIIALCLVTLSHWQKDTKKLRGIFFLTPPLWIVYDVIVGSYAGIVSELVLMFSNLLGYLKFETNKKTDAENK